MFENHALISDEQKLYIPENSYVIFQVKAGEEYRLLRFSSLDILQKAAIRFRKQMHDEATKLYNEVFADDMSIEARLKSDGFCVVPSEHTHRISVRDDYQHQCDFNIGYGDHCCWVDGCDTRSLDKLVSIDSYDRIYLGQIPGEKRDHPGLLLDELFARFNTTYADDYTGRSVSVSDVITLNINGKITSYYVEPVGFREINDFLPPINYLKNAETALEDDYDMIDGIINNGEKKSIREEMQGYINQAKDVIRKLPSSDRKGHSDLEL